MKEKFTTKVRDFVDKIDRAAGIQLIMILMTLVAYIILLSIQGYLPSFEGSQSRLITVDVLLGVGLLIEIGYFIWHTHKQSIEGTKQKKNTISDEEETENNQEEKEKG